MPSLISPLGSEKGERYSNSLVLALKGEWTLQLGPNCHSSLYMPFRGASQDLEPWDLPLLAPNSSLAGRKMLSLLLSLLKSR